MGLVAVSKGRNPTIIRTSFYAFKLSKTILGHNGKACAEVIESLIVSFLV